MVARGAGGAGHAASAATTGGTGAAASNGVAATSAATATTASLSPAAADNGLVYLHDGTLEGLFSVIFEIYQHRDHDRLADIQPGDSIQGRQFSLLSSFIEVEVNLEHAQRVQKSICQRFGEETFDRILWVFLSDDPSKDLVIYRYLRLAYAKGPQVLADMTHPVVMPFDALLLTVANERHRMLQFARFAKTPQGVYYARINPKAAVVPLIMDHFAARFNVQPFIIHDEVHRQVGVFDCKEKRWWLVSADDFQVPDCSEDPYGALWQTFYDAICIKERRNPRAQHKQMIYRYWRNLPEVQLH